jgi:hypothetical protein
MQLHRRKMYHDLGTWMMQCGLCMIVQLIFLAEMHIVDHMALNVDLDSGITATEQNSRREGPKLCLPVD